MYRSYLTCLAITALLSTTAAFAQSDRSTEAIAQSTVPAVTGVSILELKPIAQAIVRNVISIDYLLPANGHVSVALFDLHGKLVVKVRDEEMSAGHHTFRLALGTLPEGTYVCR